MIRWDWLIVALALLGLGWNFGLISGTALVVDATVPANRPRTQGAIDVLVALAGAGGGVMSGVVMAAAGIRCAVAGWRGARAATGAGAVLGAR